jgi:hypothetical protein
LNIFAAVSTGRAKIGIHISNASILTARCGKMFWYKTHIHEVSCFVQDKGLGRNLYRLQHTSNREELNGRASSRFDTLVYVQSVLQRCSIHEFMEEAANQKAIMLSEN